MSEYFEHGKISHSDDISFLFLAQTGAQGVSLSVCPTAWHKHSSLAPIFKLISSKTKADFKGSSGGPEVSSCL